MKRAPGLRTLSSQHHTGLVLARRAALAALPASPGEAVIEMWQEVMNRFESELDPHFRDEETKLLPALAAAGETALVQRTLAEHAQLRALVCRQPANAETLRSFAALLQAHIRFEERELFIVAQAKLPEFSTEAPSAHAATR